MMVGNKRQKGANLYGDQFYKTLSERDAHPLQYRQESVQLFFVEEEGLTYHLQGGLTNDCFVEYRLGGAIKDELAVNGVTVGGIANGTVFPSGTEVEAILRKMLVKQNAPSYYAPTFKLAISGFPFNLEAGSAMHLGGWQTTFDQKDAGPLTGELHTRNGAAFTPDAIPFTIGDETLNYQSTASYQEGIIKNDNLGEPYPEGHILAGSIKSNVVTFKGLRKLFFGVDNPDQNSASIRSLQSLLNPANGTKFLINIPPGARKVSFSYPASLRDASSVKYIEGLNAEVKGVFSKSLTPVEGANKYPAKEHKTYEFIPAAPFESAATYEVTI